MGRPRSRSGRRPGNEDTRGLILDAARSAFAASGFQGATIRGIAAEAGVDPALVHHYFGTKADLFGEALELPRPLGEVAEIVLANGVENAGEALARLFFSVWEAEGTRDILLGMLRGAFTAEQAATSLREFLDSALLHQVARQIPGPDARLRVTLAASHLIGVAVLRYVIGFEELIRPSADELIERVGATIQSYLTPHDPDGRGLT